jgi:tetratricopeptide (TPR) repeat protein
MDKTAHASEQQIQRYLGLLEADPDNREAFGALCGLYTTAGQWDALLRLYDREARRVSDGPSRAALYYDMGKLWDERIGNKQQAMRHYQLAYRAHPQCTDALVAARKIYRELGNWGMVTRLLELQVAAETDTRVKADLLAGLGQVFQSDLGDARRAAEALEQALALVPDHPVASEVLAGLCAERAHWREAAAELREEAEAATDPELQGSALLRAAELYHREDRGAPEAEMYIRRALEMDPTSARGREILVQILEEQGRHQELAEVLAWIAENTSQHGEKATVLSYLARFLFQIGEEDASLARFREVLSLEPENGEALTAVAQALRRRRAHDELFAVVDRALRGEITDAARMSLLREAGEAAWRDAGDRGRAAGYLDALRRLAPTDPLCLEFFRDAVPQDADAKARFAELSKAVRHEPDLAKRREAYRTMARLAEERMDSPKEAVEAWRSLLDLDRTDAAARDHLKALYRRLGRWHALVEVLKAEVEQLPPERVEEKVALYEEMADVYATRLQMEPMVVNALNALLHVAPRHRQTLDRLAAIYERRESWGQLADVLGRKAGATDDTREKLQLLHRAAEIWLLRLQSPEDAIRRYEEILALDATDVRALAALRKVYEQRRAYEPLVQVYLKEIDLLPEPAARLARAREVAEWAQKHLHRPARLIELWNKVLQFDERDGRALSSLAALYEREERWPSLTEVLQRQIAHTEEKRARVPVMKKLGQVYADRLGREDLALALWEEALGLDPDHAEVFKVLRDRYVRARSFAALEALYARRGKWEEYVDVLVVQAESAPDAAQKSDLYFQIAAIWEERLSRKDRAARVYERILEIDPRSARAALALRAVYEQAAEWRKLAHVEEVLAEASTDPHGRAQQWKRIAGLYERELRRTEIAFRYAARAVVDDPADAEAVEHAERLAEAHGPYAELARAFEEARAHTQDPALRRDLALRSAVLYDQNLRDAERAILAYEEVRAADPGNEVAQGALERLCRETRRWTELLGLLRARLASTDEPLRGAELLFEIAAIEEERLERREEAIESYKALGALLGDDPRVLAALARLYEATGRHAALAETLARALEHAPGGPEERCAVLERLGRVLMGPLGEPGAAVGRFRQLLQIDSEHAGALSALEDLLRSPAARDAALLLVEHHRPRGAWEKALQAYEVLVSATPEGARRAELLLEIGRIREQELRQPEPALVAYARAFTEDPGDSRTFAEVDRLATFLDREDELVGLLSAEMGRIENTTYRSRLTLRAGALYAELERIAEAIAAYDSALALGLPDDDARRALRALAQLHERHGDWASLHATLRRALELAETGAERKDVLLRCATLLVGPLSAPAEAAQAYRDVVALDPDEESAYRELARLYKESGDFGRLADVLASLMRFVHGPAEGSALRCKLGRILAEHLGRESEAMVELRTALELDPDNTDASAAVEALVTRVPDLRVLGAEALVPAYEARGELDKVARALEDLLPARVPFERVEILTRLASIAEQDGNLPRAWDAHLRALHEAPGEPGPRRELARLAGALGRHEDFLSAVEAELGNIPESAALAAALDDLGAVAEQQLGDAERAIGYWRRALDVDPEDEAAPAGLERLYEVRGRWRELTDLLRKRLDRATDPEAVRTLALRAGEILDARLEAFESAIECYRRAEALFPDDRAVLDGLERLYLKTRRFEDLCEITLRRADLAADPAQRAALLHDAAELLEHELGNAARAVQVYRRIADVDPRDERALRALARLHEQLGDAQALFGVLGQLVDLSNDPAERLSLRQRIGDLWRGPLHDPDQAVGIYRSILGEAPDHAPTLEALEALAESGAHRLAAARVLAPVYASQGSWERHVRALQTELSEIDDPQECARVLHRIGEVRERRLGDPAGAFAAYREALQLLPGDELTLRELERLGFELQRFEDLASLYEETLAALADPGPAKRLALKAARLYDEILQDSERAVEWHKRVLAYDPEDASALAALERLLALSGRWIELGQVLRRQIELATDPRQAVDLHHRLGNLLDAQLDDPAAALQAYGAALEIETHLPTVEALEVMLARGRERASAARMLEPVYRRAGDWEKLAALLDVEAEAQADPAERKRVFREIALLQEQRVANLDLAFASLARAFREDAADPETLTDLMRLADLTGSWEEMAALLEEEQERAGDEALRERLTLVCASIHKSQLREPEVAAQKYSAVVDRNPRCLPALRALDEIYGGLRAWPDHARVLALQADATGDAATEVVLLSRLAMLQEVELGDLDGAVATLRRVLERAPAHGPALEALERIYHRTDDASRLYEVYEMRLALCPDAPSRAAVLAAMAELAGERLGRVEEAVDLWQRVLEMLGEDERALVALERLYEAHGRWAEMCEVLARRAAAAADPETRAGLHARRARVLTDPIGADDEAVLAWKAVLEVTPGDGVALEALRELYRRGRRFPELAEVLRQMVEIGARRGAEAPALVDLYSELARVQTDSLLQPSAAMESWNRVLELDPAHREALDALEHLYESEQAWAECAALLDRRLEVAQSPEEIAEVLRRSATLYDRNMHLPERAVGLWEKVAEIRPADAEAGAALESLYERLGSWERLAELLLARLEVMESSWERLEVLRRIANLYLERLGQPQYAFIVLCRALREDPRDAALLSEAERLARDTGSFEELVAVFEDMLTTATDRDLVLSLHATLARHYAEELRRPDYAVAHYRRLLVLDEENREAIAALESVLRREGRLAELAEVLRRKASLAIDLREKKDHLFDLAQLWERSLENPMEAATALQEIVRLDPRDAVALEALGRIYREQARWRDLIEVLERKLAICEEREAEIALRKETAAIYDRELGEGDRAAEVYREILSLDPARTDVREELESILTVQHRWDELVELLTEEIPFAQGPAAEVALHEKIAALWEEQLGHPERAIESYRAMLRIEPRHDDALQSLERIYESQGRWRDLVDVLERRAAAAGAPAQAVPHLKRLGAVYEERLADHGQAAGAYRRALEIAPDDPELLAAEAGIHEAAGDYVACAEALERAARLSTDRHTSAQIWDRVAAIALGRLRDPARAEGALRYAIGADPSYLPALRALQELYASRGDWRHALALLQREEEQTADPDRKVELLAEMGRITASELRDPVGAGRYFEMALERKPEHLESARRLSDLYFDRGEAERARALLEMVVRRAAETGLEARELARYRHRLAVVTEKAGDELAALRHYQEAYESDLSYLPTLLALGDLLFRRGDWDRAFKVYQSLVVHHSDNVEVNLVDVYHRLGVIRHKLGERRKAVHSFDKALELDPGHVPTLEALAQVHQEAGEWLEAAGARRKLFDLCEDPERKLELAVALSDLHHDKLRNPQKAVETLLDALDSAPGNLVLLHKLLELYTEAKQWRRAIEVLEQISGLEKDAEKLATYQYSVAVIYRDELKEIEPAIEHFNKTLDANPQRLKAFEAIDKLLTQRRDWPALARNYRRMIERLGDSAPLELRTALWRNLGEIHRSRLRDFGEAIPCFKKASELAPEDITLHVILAELYEDDPATREDAVREHRVVLAADPQRADSYHALYRLYRNAGEDDRAFRVCHALQHLGKADANEAQYFEAVRPKAPKRPQRALDERAWQLLMHPSEDRLLGRIFAFLTPAVAGLYLVHPKDLGVKKKDRIDTTDLQIFFNKMFQLARGVLGVAPPEVYLRAEGHMGLTLMNTAPVTLLVGPDMAQDRPEPQLTFALGKHLSYLRPEHFLSALLPPLVETIFYAGVRACFPTQKLPDHVDKKESDELAKRIEKALPPAGLAQLRSFLQQFYQVTRKFDPDAWLASIERSAERVGFILGNDLPSAERILQQEPVAISKRTRAEKIRDLLLFSVSEEYFTLRKALGMAVQL